MFHTSTDLHRARVGSVMTAALFAVITGLFPLNEAVYLVAGRTTDAAVTTYHTRPSGRWRWYRSPRNWVEYTYRDSAGREHHDSGRISRSAHPPGSTHTLKVEYHALPWRSSRPVGVNWIGLSMFGVAGMVTACLALWHHRELGQFWRREREMAGF